MENNFNESKTAASATTLKDKKRVERIRITRDVGFDIVVDNLLIPIYFKDISKFGAKIESPKIVRPGNSIQVKFSFFDIVPAKVIWCKVISKNLYHFGIEFDEEWMGDPEHFRELENVIDRGFERKVPSGKVSFNIWAVNNEVITKEKVTVIDISEGGTKLKCIRAWQRGEQVTIEIREGVELNGIVRWCSESRRGNEKICFIGIQFNKKQDTDGQDKEVEKIKLQLAKDPDNIAAYNNLGMELRKKKRYKEAIINYQKALKVEVHNEILFYNMARVYLDMEDKTKAIQYLEKSIKLNPQFNAAESLLAKLKAA